MSAQFRPPTTNVPIGSGYFSYGASPFGPPTSGFQSYGAAPAQAAPVTIMKQPSYAEDEGESIELKSSKGKTTMPGFLGFPAMDILAAVVVFAAPLIIFMMVYGLVAFDFRFRNAFFAWLLVFVVFGLVAAAGVGAFLLTRREANGETDHYSACAAALFIGMLAAFFTALAIGGANYSKMVANYEATQLNTYNGGHGLQVDPSKMGGKAFMDAGTLEFVGGTHLDMTKSVGFRNLDMYCVAPIVSGSKTASYDFWAVGTNCCTGAANDFHCGDAVEHKYFMKPAFTMNKPGGIRLMSGSELPFYKLAVTQAMSKYGIQSNHPIFVTWVRDVDQALNGYGQFGGEHFLNCVLYFSIFMLFVVLGAAVGAAYVKSKYT